jgi:hypothetical protein
MKMLVALLLAGLCASAHGQTRHDPLNSREVELMRDSAQEPIRRIDLLIGFSRERVMTVEQLHGTAKDGGDNAGTLAGILDELTDLIDELDDNLEMYSKHGADLRRPLSHVLEAEAELHQKLRSLEDSATPPEKRRIAIALEDASDSLQSSMDSAKSMLAAQIEKRGEEKDKEKLDRQEANAKGKRRQPEQ